VVRTVGRTAYHVAPSGYHTRVHPRIQSVLTPQPLQTVAVHQSRHSVCAGHAQQLSLRIVGRLAALVLSHLHSLEPTPILPGHVSSCFNSEVGYYQLLGIFLQETR
jgi:hypothetical protein